MNTFKKILTYIGGTLVFTFGLSILVLPAMLLGKFAPPKSVPEGPLPIGITSQKDSVTFSATNVDGCVFSVQIPTSPTNGGSCIFSIQVPTKAKK